MVRIPERPAAELDKKTFDKKFRTEMPVVVKGLARAWAAFDRWEPAQLKRVPNLPELLDIIIDDGSHRFHDQETMLLTLWPRLRPGGFYVKMVEPVPLIEIKQAKKAVVAHLSSVDFSDACRGITSMLS